MTNKPPESDATGTGETPVTAVFVDGVGHIQHVQLPQWLPVVRRVVPRQMQVSAGARVRPTFDDGIAEFWSITQLPDGRWVYGFRFSSGAQYEVWKVSAVFTDAMKTDRGAAESIAREINQQIQHIGNAPCVRLLSLDRRDDDRGLTERVVMGVARR